MSDRLTEALHPNAVGLDARPDAEILSCLLAGQIAAVHAVEPALAQIAQGAALVEKTLRGPGRLYYVGAGSSALMGNADGMELAGTFGTDPNRVRLCMAGGMPVDSQMPGGTEDDTDQADRDAVDLGRDDAAIIVTASGSTPYALRFAQLAAAAGAATICIANNEGAALFDHADVAICLPTPPEIIAGSTRMGAGTAQKVALNMMSTLMAVRLGHIHDGMMVNLRADNDKLRARATGMVARIADVADAQARAALEATDWDVKTAALTACGIEDPGQVLARHNGNLRAALATGI